MAEALQQLERRDSNFREEGVDEAGDEEPDAHLSALFQFIIRMAAIAAKRVREAPPGTAHHSAGATS
jgi:hypothetical protein